MRYRVRSGQRQALLDEKEVVIGRSAYCSLILDTPTVSRLHAAVRRVVDRLEIADLGSTYGTFVNGKRITEPTPVDVGDAIEIGGEPLEIEDATCRESHTTGGDYGEANVFGLAAEAAKS
jgi:pSer/pThr/pTyr-binding forkhead associated (FHA) protein